MTDQQNTTKISAVSLLLLSLLLVGLAYCDRRNRPARRAYNQVFGMAISTILQCFIADEEMFKGDDRYGEGDLAEMLENASKNNSTGQARVVAVETKADAGGGPAGAGDHALP